MAEFDEYAQWVEKITYDSSEQLWVACFHPNKIVKCMQFKTVGIELTKHVMAEVLQLIADVLRVKYSDILKKSRKPEFTHARFVATIILIRRFPSSLTMVKNVIGYASIASVYHAGMAVESNPEVKRKLQRVYQAHPFLYTRNSPIK